MTLKLTCLCGNLLRHWYSLPNTPRLEVQKPTVRSVDLSQDTTKDIREILGLLRLTGDAALKRSLQNSVLHSDEYKGPALSLFIL
jgi:hypothetical protein